MKSSFHKDETKDDGFHPKRKLCREKFPIDNKDRLLNKQKIYNKENRDQKIGYQKKIYLDS